MPVIARHHVLTLADYLAVERTSPRKHEFSDGQIYLMAGGSPRHNYLAANTVAALHRALRGGPCFPLTADQRIRTSDGLYTYSDGSVFCGALDLAEEQTATNPMLLVEVLSDSTRTYDRGDKLELYKAIPTLRHVVLIEPDGIDVEVWSRRGDAWVREVRVERTDRVVLDALGIALSVGDIYEDFERIPA
jgi:Uma2 family endonuclease